MDNQKPITVLVEELKQRLIEDVNGANLHIVLIKPIVEEVNLMVQNKYQQVYQQELQQYKQVQVAKPEKVRETDVEKS